MVTFCEAAQRCHLWGMRGHTLTPSPDRGVKLRCSVNQAPNLPSSDTAFENEEALEAAGLRLTAPRRAGTAQLRGQHPFPATPRSDNRDFFAKWLL